MRNAASPYERLPRAAELFLTREGAADLRHAVVVVRLGRPDPAAPGQLTRERLAAQVASRLHLVPPRFRRVVRHTPLGLAAPILVDDAGFDLANHVRELGAGTVSEAELAALIAEYSREPLDRPRPLWEIALTPSSTMAGGRFSSRCTTASSRARAASRTRRCTPSTPPDAEPGTPEPWEAEPAPGRLAQVRLAVVDQPRRIGGLVRGPY